MIEEIKNIKSGKKELREFGIVICAALIIIAGVGLLRHKAWPPYLIITGIIFGGLGVLAPFLLLPFQKIWMAFALIIGFFMSRIVLTILFYFVITPIGLLTKLFGKDILDQKIQKNKASYWIPREQAPKTKESYENQY